MRTKRAKAPRRSHHRQSGPIRPSGKMPKINPHAAGVDVGSVEHWVCVPEDSVSQGQTNVRSFGGFTADLDQLVEWLLACGVKTVAMEATGVYWKPVYYGLEGLFEELWLCNAQHVKNVPGDDHRVSNPAAGPIPTRAPP